MTHIVTLLLIGLSVGLGNLAASIAIGLSGVNRSDRIRIGVVFGLFETGMPIIGIVLGHQLANVLGSNASHIGGALLVFTGLYIIIQAILNKQHHVKHAATLGSKKLLLTGLALSIDNLVIGFSLGTADVALVGAVISIGVMSVLLSLIGLEIGNRLKASVSGYSELFSGGILVIVGLAVGLQLL